MAPEPTAPRAWRLAGLVISQTALLTALLFYFGWARTRATFGYFGVDVSLLGFSTSDYLLRSVNSAYRPLLIAGLVALAAIAVHRRWSDELRRAARPIAVAGLVVVAVGLLGLAWDWWGAQLGRWLPVCLAVGFGLLAYHAHLTGRRQAIESVLLTVLALLAVFWAVSLLAERTGLNRALAFQRSLPRQSELVLFSKQKLAISGLGVTNTPLNLEDSAYEYRYGGLRLLVHSDGRYIALPVGWKRGESSAYVVPERDDLRAELIAP